MFCNFRCTVNYYTSVSSHIMLMLFAPAWATCGICWIMITSASSSMRHVVWRSFRFVRTPRYYSSGTGSRPVTQASVWLVAFQFVPFQQGADKQSLSTEFCFQPHTRQLSGMKWSLRAESVSFGGMVIASSWPRATFDAEVYDSVGGFLKHVAAEVFDCSSITPMYDPEDGTSIKTHYPCFTY